MRPWFIVILAASAVGCDLSRSRTYDSQEAFYHSAVTGVISPPNDGTVRSTASFCSSLAVSARTEDGAEVGRPSIHVGQSRCSYEIAHLPADSNISISVTSDSGVCANGGPAVVAPPSKSVKLEANQSVVQDFQAQCTAQAATAS